MLGMTAAQMYHPAVRVTGQDGIIMVRNECVVLTLGDKLIRASADLPGAGRLVASGAGNLVKGVERYV